MDYFLGTKHLGYAPDPKPDPRYDAALSLAFFCPKCSQIWGRVIVNPSHHHVLTSGCPSCGPAWAGDEAGTFLRPTDVWWNNPALHLTNHTPFAVLMNDFIQLEKLNDQPDL